MEAILISLRSPGAELLRLGSITLRWYGLLIAISIYIGLNLSNKLAYHRKISNEIINDLLPILLISSIAGARLYYVILEWRNYSGINFWGEINFLGISIPIPALLEVWRGGIAIHGALIMGTISVLIFCFFRNENFWNVMDVLLPSVILGQSIGRWGNFFNNEAFGLPTNLPWKLFIPYSSRPDVFLEFNYFHPTFLYESIWNICVFAVLIILFRSNVRGFIKLPYGALTCIYLIGYGSGRIWIESLRIDPLCIGALPPFCSGGIKIAQLISFLMICIGSFALYWIYQNKRRLPTIQRTSKRKK